MKSPSFKIIVVLLGLPLFVALADLAWTQAPLSKFKTNGVSAYYEIQEFFSESEGSYATRYAYVSISQGEGLTTLGISGPYYNLNFQVSVSTTTGFGSMYGSGPIPVQYVSFDKPANHNLSLNVDTGILGDPFFISQYGDIPIQNPVIALRWTRDDNNWYRWEGHQIQEFGNLVEHSQGSGIRYYTVPTGSITLPPVDLPLAGTYMSGWLGSEKSTIWVLQRGPIK